MQKNVQKMTINYSPNFDLKKRDKKKIKYLIFHYTGMINDRSAIKKNETKTKENDQTTIRKW